MGRKSLQIQQLDGKMSLFPNSKKLAMPPTGWIKAVRTAIGMSMQQLGNRLSVTKQSVQDMEIREQNGSITIKSLREAATALDMELVYGFIAKDGSLNQLIERKATELARQIVLRTHNNMKLEEQDNSTKRINNAIRERAAIIQYEMPKSLWD